MTPTSLAASMAAYTKNQPHLLSTTILLSAAITVLPACSVVSVSKQASAKTISAQRGNIVTENKLSSDTTSTLLSAGLNEQACFQQFDLCLDQLADSMLNQHYRPELAVFSELHYAKARQLAKSSACRDALARPPLDPYYANADPTAEQAAEQKQAANRCLLDYQARLFDAVKYSYTYLFYDSLTHDFEGAEKSGSRFAPPNRIPSDLDIQTQDIYNAASNDIVTQLYATTGSAYKLMGDTKVRYLPIDDQLNDSAAASVANHAPIKGAATDQIQVMQTQIGNYRLNTYMPNENNYLQNAHRQTSALADLVSTYEIRLSGLNSISKRPGLGISLVASLDDRYTTTIKQLLVSSLSGRLSQNSSSENRSSNDPLSRIYPTGHLLMTGLIQPAGTSVLDVLSSEQLDVHLYNPYRSESVTILGDEYPLAANFSAGYGLWLSENQLDGVGYLNLLAHKEEASLPKLFMLEPYDPNKRVIIMIHGLASSPTTWVNLTNDIFNDDKLRENYQVWQIFYPTNLPILENRYQIQKLIETTYQQTDPSGQNRASKHSVIVSHSMGAVIARMMLSDDDLRQNLGRLDDNSMIASNSKRQIDTMLRAAFDNEDLRQRFTLQTLPQVDTAVFLSAPFQGTDYADRWFTRAIRRIIYLPISVIKTVTDNLTTIATEGELADNPLGALYLQNGASQLSDKSSFIKLTRNIQIDKRITYHTIIASNDEDITQGLAQMQPSGAKIDLSKALPETSTINNNERATSPPAAATNERDPLIASVMVNKGINSSLTARLSDGIVPYRSAHLDGAASETVISGGHSIQENPQTVLNLRRILHQQLEQ